MRSLRVTMMEEIVDQRASIRGKVLAKMRNEVSKIFRQPRMPSFAVGSKKGGGGVEAEGASRLGKFTLLRWSRPHHVIFPLRLSCGLLLLLQYYYVVPWTLSAHCGTTLARSNRNERILDNHQYQRMRNSSRFPSISNNPQTQHFLQDVDLSR